MLFRLDPGGQDRADPFMERPEVVQRHRFKLDLLRQHSDAPYIRFLRCHIATPQNNQWGTKLFPTKYTFNRRQLQLWRTKSNLNNYTPTLQRLQAEVGSRSAISPTSAASARSSPAPFTARPGSPRAFATHEWPQPPTNELHVCQGPFPEFDLCFENRHVPEGGRGNNKTTHILLKSIQRGLNKIHFNLPTQTSEKTINNKNQPGPFYNLIKANLAGIYKKIIAPLMK
jgi:hypothetical protein